MKVCDILLESVRQRELEHPGVNNQEEFLDDVPRIGDHEGRHRMDAILQVYGDVPIETHITFYGGLRNRHITDEVIDHIQWGMISEDGRYVSGSPLFTYPWN